MSIKTYNTDCIKFMNNHKDFIDLILTSPPYNMTKRKGGDADTNRYDEYNDWKKPKEYLNWSVNIFNHFNNVLIKNGIVVYNFSYSIENPSFPYQLVSEIVSKTNFCIADTIIWKKPHSMPFPASPNRLQRIYEFIFIFVRKDEIKSFTTNKQISKVSPTNQTYAKPNKDFIVYDSFLGTGTTAIGCIKYGCSFLGTEISEKQFDYTNNRINKELKEVGLFNG